MLSRFRHPAVRAVAFVAALLWAWTVTAGQVHRLLVEHVVCDAHDQMMERHGGSDPSAEEPAETGPRWTAAPPHGVHDHGCATASVVPSEPPPAVVLRAVTRLTWKTVDPLALAEAPRGPPLAYAPKTSPPAA